MWGIYFYSSVLLVFNIRLPVGRINNHVKGLKAQGKIFIPLLQNSVVLSYFLPSLHFFCSFPFHKFFYFYCILINWVLFSVSFWICICLCICVGMFLGTYFTWQSCGYQRTLVHVCFFAIWVWVSMSGMTSGLVASVFLSDAFLPIKIIDWNKFIVLNFLLYFIF